MSDSFHVRLSKERFTFCAAHFITFNGDVCERLHGHNYQVAVEWAGPLDENQYVIDFIALRDAIVALVAELDHAVLLPTRHRSILVVTDGSEVTATFAERRWVFPQNDCRLLPVTNTTAEELARYLGGRLLARLVPSVSPAPRRLRVEVDECQGQIGVWETEPGN